MVDQNAKKIAFYPKRKIFSQKFIRWNAELDERKKIFDIMGTLIQLVNFVHYKTSCTHHFNDKIEAFPSLQRVPFTSSLFSTVHVTK